MKPLSEAKGAIPRLANGWRSQGGAGRAHPDRALPTRLTVEVPPSEGPLESVSLVGVLAMHADPESEPSGVVGGRVLLFTGESNVFSLNLVHGFHYGDATSSADVYRLNGDGTSLETVGHRNLEGRTYRVDRLTVSLPSGIAPDKFVLLDLGTPASFVIDEVLFAYAAPGVCPFRGKGENVALADIGAVLRLRDRASFDKALRQLRAGVLACGRDLDEARGLALTFVGSVVGALLELDAQRSLHKELLEAARELEPLTEPSDVASAASRRVLRLTEHHMPRDERDETVKRAIEILSRNFAGSLDADAVARELGLSTSHFRHLFRETTRQPFQKYVVSLRLEKARELLLQTKMPVSAVARRVGFQSSAHFSRAFAKRFGSAPSALRQTRR